MNTLTNTDLQRRRQLLALLRDLPEGESSARAQWLAQRCGGDTELLQQAQAALAAAGGLLDGDADALVARLASQVDSTLLPGARIGAWRIDAVLGHGGMGTVYLAERAGDGFTQRGALKLIKRGMDSDAVLTRFRRERRILSALEHPNIARLLDGGVSVDGQPYFVMEYVEGRTLHQWAMQAHPDLAARMMVFFELGAAVAHAHQHLIVHRDIKPENVLVDGAGHARLLDFGIAKLLQDEGDGAATSLHGRFVSRDYAAPEQIQGDVATTATDIYQLGIVLFELLTGARFGELHSSGRDSDWLKRAQRVGDNALRSAIAAASLRGDIAVVLARATDADPQRRYATVEALCADVRAWREGRPIAARPDSVGYRVRRLVGRHRVASAAVALALLAVLGGASLALWQAREAGLQARRAQAEAASARASQQFMLDVFTQAEPWRNGGEQPTALELAEQALSRVDRELAGQPSARADMYFALARLFTVAGDVRLSTEAASKAVATLQAMPDVDARRLFEARMRLAYTYLYNIDFDRAEAELDAIEKRGGVHDAAQRLAMLSLRRDLARDRGRAQGAQSLAEAAVDLAKNEDAQSAGEAWWQLAQAERVLGHYAQARAAARASRAQRLRQQPLNWPILNHALLTAWTLAAETDTPRAALTHLHSLVARVQQIFGASIYTANALLTFAQAQRRAQHPRRAEALLREALRMVVDAPGSSAFDAAALKVELASSLIDVGHAPEAQTLLAAADAAYARVGGVADPRRWFIRVIAARADPRDAAGALRAAWHEHLPDMARERPQALLWMARAEYEQGKVSAAQAHWRQTLAELERQGRPLSALAWQAHAGLADSGDVAERGIACAQARALFGVAAPQSHGCDSSAPVQPAAAPSDAQLERLGARIDTAVPVDAASDAWLDALLAAGDTAD